jgi:hypothetical protein
MELLAGDRSIWCSQLQARWNQGWNSGGVVVAIMVDGRENHWSGDIMEVLSAGAS